MASGASARLRGARSSLLAPLVLICLAVAPGCRTTTGPSLAHTLESPEAVARAVVQGLAEKNLEALRALAVTEAEFRDLVWPKLPSSRPERNLPLEYVWGDLATKSDANLRARLGGWEDRGFVLVSVTFKGGADDYGTYRVHRETILVLRDRDGKEQTGRLFGSLIEHKGRFKVFSYVVD